MTTSGHYRVRTLDLNGSWQFRKADEPTWREGRVPGSLLTDLLALGEIPDPFDGDREYELQPVFEESYEYRKTFVFDPADVPGCHYLRFDGLDTLADVRLNGELILRTDNMFRSYERDVASLLKQGENEIVVRFGSPVRYMRERQREKPLFGIPMVIEGYTHLRKAHYMSGWDWGPKLPDCGIWRDVSLVSVPMARWKDVSIRQRHGEGQVSLEIGHEVDEREPAADRQVRVELTSPDGTIAVHTAALTTGRESISVPVERPRLWWPNGFGEQPLYRVSVALLQDGEQLDCRAFRIGLRTLTVNTDEDEWGSRFAFEVNGVRIFSMGADYVPEDNLLGRLSRERTEKLIRDCVRANFNTIRVWGGGFYPLDDFYDLCDEAGIILWQDFMFACGLYDFNDAFVANSLTEIEENVKRMRHHACIGLFCGNNEIEMFFDDGRIENSEANRRSFHRFFDETIPELLAGIAPDVFYWPGSPSSGVRHAESNAENRGDGHYWEVWHNNKPFADYRNTYFRYMSEFGFESMPHVRTIESFARPEDRNLFSYAMECHQKNPSGNQKILAYLAESYRYPKDFASLVYVSQLLQAEAMRYGVEHWRRHRGRCMGTLYWQLNDCWPTLSWSSIDFFGRWKALHYAARKFYAPILASACEEGDSVSFHVSNETLAPIAGKLVWEARRTDGPEALGRGEADARVEALSTGLVCRHDFGGVLTTTADRQSVYVAFAFLADGLEISSGTVLFVPTKHARLHRPSIQAELTESEDRYRIALRTDRFAKSVELSVEGRDAVFDDNYFDLSPGRVREIQLLKSDLDAFLPLERLRESLRIRSAFDTYA